MSTLYEQILQKGGVGRSQLEIFKAVTQDCENIVVVKGDSKSISLPANRVSFGFIDGNHSPPYVRNDFHLIWEKLSPKGVIGFDDYGDDLPQVTSTIDGLMEQYSEEIAQTWTKGRFFFVQRR
jgi:hypothetical protein